MNLLPETLNSTPDPFKSHQPGRIEHYTPGHSSIADKEAKEVGKTNITKGDFVQKHTRFLQFFFWVQSDCFFFVF